MITETLKYHTEMNTIKKEMQIQQKQMQMEFKETHNGYNKAKWTQIDAN